MIKADDLLFLSRADVVSVQLLYQAFPKLSEPASILEEKGLRYFAYRLDSIDTEPVGRYSDLPLLRLTTLYEPASTPS